MVAYLVVYGRDPSDRFAAYSFATRTEARQASLPAARLVPHYPESSHAGGCAYVIEHAADVTFGTERLQQVYTALTGSAPPTWSTRAEGVDALLAALGTHTHATKNFSIIGESQSQTRNDENMTAYLVVYGRTPTDRFAAYRFDSKIKARNAAPYLTPTVPENADDSAGGCSYVIERPEDVPFSGMLLAQVYALLTGEDPERFEYRWEGVTKLMEALSKWAADAPARPRPAVPSQSQRGRRAPEGRMTLRQQMDYYNTLVDAARSKGLTRFRHLGGPKRTNTFATYRAGENAISKIRQAIAEVEEPQPYNVEDERTEQLEDA